MPADAVLDGLRKACGPDGARTATERDAVDGVPAAYVAVPPSTDAVADTLRIAAEHGLPVVVRGKGTKLDWGTPPESVGVLLDCTGMDGLIEHAAGDLVVQVQAGATLAATQDALAPAGQMLALDEPVAGATIGGTVATATSGPRRMLYGTCRDLLIGLTVVRADGTVTRAGGKVVKNVAGYDLCKLYTGSFGTLGVITEAVFRLHPQPPAAAAVSITVATAEEAQRASRAVRAAQVVPSALEVDRPEAGGALTVTVLLEGVEEGVDARASEVAALLGADAHVARGPEALPAGWTAYPWNGDGVGLKVTGRLSALGVVLEAIDEAARAAGVPVAVRGSLGSGVLYAGLPGSADPGAVAAAVEALRARVASYDGFVTVVRAPAGVREAVDVWGPVRGLDLMRRVKEQFDPGRRLAPGRFVGGI